jgi:hypothetical protein
MTEITEPTQTQAPTPAEPTPPAPPAQAQEPAPETGGEQPDALSRLEQKFDQFLTQQQAEPTVPEPTDLLSALEQGSPEEPTAPEPQAPNGQAEQQFADPAAQQQVEELRQFIRAEAEEANRPIAEAIRRQELAAVEQDFPDITSKDVMDRLKPLMTTLAQESGNEDIIDNPAFLRMAYKAVKAELADADAVPAEQAGNGASLETQAGQSQVGSPSDDEDYINRVFGNQAPKSVIG